MILNNTDQKTTLALSFNYKGKQVVETGYSVSVTVDNSDVLTAAYDGTVIQVVPVADSIGSAVVTVVVTLTDGTVITSTEAFDIIAPHADALTLPGTVETK